MIGVARDAKYGDLRETAQWVFYLPLAQSPGPRTRTLLLVRTEGDPLTLVAIVLLSAAGLVASVAPARRAAGIDARVALSAE